MEEIKGNIPDGVLRSYDLLDTLLRELLAGNPSHASIIPIIATKVGDKTENTRLLLCVSIADSSKIIPLAEIHDPNHLTETYYSPFIAAQNRNNSINDKKDID